MITLPSDDHGIPFGEDSTGRLISVDRAERGLACGLVCPRCGCRLVAKKGDVIRHHFAHDSDQACSGAYESAIHKAAKQIISDNLSVWLPSGEITVGGRFKPLFDTSKMDFDRVELEVWMNGMQPDIMGHKRDRSLAIEVLVTHHCTPEKLALIKTRKIATMEIDLSLIPRDITFEALSGMVLQSAPRVWIFNAKIENARSALRRDIAAEKAREVARLARAAADLEAKKTREQRAADELRRKFDAEQKQLQEKQAERQRLLDEEWNAKQEIRRAKEAKDLAEKAAEQQRLDEIAAACLKAELKESADRCLGPVAANEWLSNPLRAGSHRPIPPVCSLTSGRSRDIYFESLDAVVGEKIGREVSDKKAAQELRSRAVLILGSPDKVDVWLNAKNPKLGMDSPIKACGAPGGVERCLATLAKRKMGKRR